MNMKLLKTIKGLVKESEDNLEKALNSNVNTKELEVLKENYENSLNLISLYENLENEKED
jgi:hypothetical protein